MEVFWQRGSISIREVREALPTPRPAYTSSLTFARIAQAEHALGNQEAAAHAHTEVEKGYTAAVNELPQVQGLTAEQRQTLESKLEQLRVPSHN